MKKIMLFNGTDLSGFTQRDGSPAIWEVADGCMTVTKGDIVSKEVFGDAHIHVEWREPDMPEAVGQGKGNSGVYIHGCYELQVLDSYGIEPPQDNDCGAIYCIQPARVNARKPALEWQSYDIYIRAAKLDGDKQVQPAIVTIFQNDILIHNNLPLPTNTPGGIYNHVVEEGPLMLQDHGDRVSFRNVWIEKL